MRKIFYSLAIILGILLTSFSIQEIYAESHYSEMTDDELLERFQELMNSQDLELPIEALRDETAAAEFMEKVDEWWAESKQIIKILKEREWEISPLVVTREDGSEVEVLDFSDPNDIKLNQEIFGNLDIELMIKSPEKLVEEYNFLIDKFDKLGTNSEQLEINHELIDEINSDLEHFENIVISLQNQGYDGIGGVELVDGKMIGTVSFFDKYSLEPLFKRQIPQGTINIFGTMGLMKEFEVDGVPLSYEEQIIMLNSSSALVGTIATFNDPSDPNSEISSGMILAAIGAYHPSVDNLKNSESELLSSEEIPSLKIQEKSGVAPFDIVCREGLQKIFKSTDKSPSCVKPITAVKLIERGWAWDLK